MALINNKYNLDKTNREYISKKINKNITVIKLSKKLDDLYNLNEYIDQVINCRRLSYSELLEIRSLKNKNNRLINRVEDKLILTKISILLDIRSKNKTYKNFEDELSLEFIGLIRGVSREAVKQIQDNALRKLRYPKLGRHLKKYLKF